MIAWLLSTAWALSPPPVCETVGDGMPDGPTAFGLYAGDLGRARRACPRTEVGLALGGGALLDIANFYGNLGGGATIDGSWRAADRLELFGAVEAFHYETVISGITSSAMGLGHTSLGATYVVHESETLALGATGRAVLPTAFGLYRNAWPFGLDLGMNGMYAFNDRFRLHGQLSATGSAAATAGDADPRLGAIVNAGVELRPLHAFGFTIDLGSRIGMYAPLDALTAGLGLRLAFGDLGLELGAVVPVAGRERQLARGGLRASYRF